MALFPDKEERMEVLFATNNPAKIKIYADKLKENGIELKNSCKFKNK